MRIDATATEMVMTQADSTWWVYIVDAFQVAGVTVVGFFVLAVVTSSIGYLAAGGIWRVIVGRKVARKRAKRVNLKTASLDPERGSK